MKRHRISGKVITRYVLFQIPGYVIVCGALYLGLLWLDIPGWAPPIVIFLWFAKDVVLFFFTWEAYDWGREEDRVPLLGKSGVVVEPLAPMGRIRIQGELWNAELRPWEGNAVPAGASVNVSGMEGLRLIVQPVTDDHATGE